MPPPSMDGGPPGKTGLYWTRPGQENHVSNVKRNQDVLDRICLKISLVDKAIGHELYAPAFNLHRMAHSSLFVLSYCVLVLFG